MENQQIKKGAFQKFKEKGKEKRQKIKKFIIKRRDDFLTAFEKSWRDWFFRPLTKLFYKFGITANHITYTGFLLIAAAIFLKIKGGSMGWQLLFMILTALTDAFDGPMARNNNNVTILGTWLDHIRDYTLIAWITYLIYFYKLLSLQTIILLWSLELLLIWILIKDFITRYLKGLSEEEEKVLIHKFSLDNLQTSITGRLQFFCWLTAYGFFLTSLLINSATFISIGNVFITLTIIFCALNISEAAKKSI